MTLKPDKISDPEHERFVRSLPCVCCGDNTTTELAHVSYPDPRFAKYGRGKGSKEESCWCLPLCGQHHRRQHSFPGGERAFWQAEGIDPVRVCAALYVRTGNINAAQMILEHARDP